MWISVTCWMWTTHILFIPGYNATVIFYVCVLQNPTKCMCPTKWFCNMDQLISRQGYEITLIILYAFNWLQPINIFTYMICLDIYQVLLVWECSSNMFHNNAVVFYRPVTSLNMVFLPTSLTTVIITIVAMQTESANYGTRANITSIPPAVSERDDFIYIRKNPIHRIAANAFLSYSNLKSLILLVVWVDLQYIEEGAFNGQDKWEIFNIRQG